MVWLSKTKCRSRSRGQSNSSRRGRRRPEAQKRRQGCRRSSRPLWKPPRRRNHHPRSWQPDSACTQTPASLHHNLCAPLVAPHTLWSPPCGPDRCRARRLPESSPKHRRSVGHTGGKPAVTSAKYGACLRRSVLFVPYCAGRDTDGDADVNANMPRSYWDYDSVNISWGVLENYEVVRKIGEPARIDRHTAQDAHANGLRLQAVENIPRSSKASTSSTTSNA